MPSHPSLRSVSLLTTTLWLFHFPMGWSVVVRMLRLECQAVVACHSLRSAAQYSKSRFCTISA